MIRKSQSPYASNVVIVRKKSGALRFCLDMILNSWTIPDSYSLPRIDSTLDILSGAKWFSVLDLKSGYWQVPLAEEDKCKTAFTVRSWILGV